ncbi:MAG: CAAX prenyl protease-related protein, partial [Geobacteraceae bacterium]|nr:CAAX prenyl protease-related protein [Geobacteraceae bacterium]
IVRIIGASIIVPIMEELFWRSFLLRYLIDVDFESVPLGTYTPSSFLITIILFGFEHHLILAGIAAGLAYNLLLYKTRSLALCIVSHSITNIILAGYVVCYMRWDLW